MRTHFTQLAVVAAAAVAVACSPDVITSKQPPSVFTSLLSEGHSAPQAHQGDLARRVALTLADPAIRQQVKRDMRDALNAEYKLPFTSYGRGRGAALFHRIAYHGASSVTTLHEELQALPPLEFYMPVPEHRRTWRGDDDVVVAAQLDDADQPIAWDTRGNRVSLSLAAPPGVPVLVLVPVETDFTKVLSFREVQARGNPLRETIEDPTPAASRHQTFGLECDTPDCGGGGGSGGSSAPAGLYITFQRLVDLGEPWTLGAPEIEVHVHGPQSPSAALFGQDLACSGDRVGYPRGFNQDGAFWSGSALVFDQYQIDAYNAISQSGFNVSVWEDDNASCAIRNESFDLADRMRQIGTAVGGYTAVKAAPTGLPKLLAAGVFVASVYSSVSTLWTNDDFLGTYVNAATIGQSLPDANHVLYRNGSTVNGRAMLIQKAAQ